MQKKTSLIILLFCFIFISAGCESNAVRRDEASSQHPEWSDYDKQMIAGGMIRPGMTKDQVRASWGKPCGNCTGTKIHDSGVESWEYQTQVVFFDKNGKVTRWVER